MTTFAEMQAAVIEKTKRPELTDLTSSAIRMATTRAHQVDFFRRDQALGTLNYTVDTSQIFVDIANVFNTLTRLRQFDFVQCIDLTTLQPSENLEFRDFKDFWNGDNELRQSVFTLIGSTLRVHPQVQTGRFSVVYYQNPDVATATYSSWIADSHMDELAFWAAGIVWARTGNTEQARIAQTLHVEPFKEMLITSYLTAKV